VNPYNDVGNPLTLTSTRGVMLGPKLLRVVQEAVRQQSETGYPQAIILSGEMTRLLSTMGASLKASRGQDGQMMLLMHKSEKNCLLLCSYIAHCMGFILYAINIPTIDSTNIYRNVILMTYILCHFYFQHQWWKVESNIKSFKY
jgi:hypothetical protein